MAQRTKRQRADEVKREKDIKRRTELVRSSKGLMPYGTPEELQEMVTIMAPIIPGAKRLSDDEIVSLCRTAFALGLNPLVGEIWSIDGTPSVGIRGLRRKGRDQLVDLYGPDGVPVLDFVQIVKKAEREELQIPPGALAFKCIGMIPAKRKAWARDAKELREALGNDAPYEVILENIGAMPKTIGYGYVTAEQMHELDNPRWYHKCSENDDENVHERWYKGKKWFGRELRGMESCPDCGKESYAKPPMYPHAQRSMKRAEAHFWKLECDLPFDIRPSGEGLAEDIDVHVPESTGDVVDGEARELYEGKPEASPEEMEARLALEEEERELKRKQSEKSKEEVAKDAKEGSDALFGSDDEDDEEDDEPRPIRPGKPKDKSWDSNVIDVIKDANVVPKVEDKRGYDITARRIIFVLKKSPFTDADPPKWVIEWLKLYYNHRKNKVSKEESRVKATREWVKSMQSERDNLVGAFGEDWVESWS